MMIQWYLRDNDEDVVAASRTVGGRRRGASVVETRKPPAGFSFNHDRSKLNFLNSFALESSKAIARTPNRLADGRNHHPDSSLPY